MTKSSVQDYRHMTTAQINEIINNLEKAMDAFPSSNDGSTKKNNKGSLPRNLVQSEGFDSIFPNEIWLGFLSYCDQNELDPTQQIREAIASHYQDLLNTYRIRMTLRLSDKSDQV